MRVEALPEAGRLELVVQPTVDETVKVTAGRSLQVVAAVSF
jgi:hypothetical protein